MGQELPLKKILGCISIVNYIFGFMVFGFVVSSVSLSLSHCYPGSGVVLDCIDS